MCKDRLQKSRLRKSRSNCNLGNYKEETAKKKNIIDNKGKKVKCKFKIIVRLKTIKYSKEFLCYFSFYISFLVFNFYIYFFVIFPYYLTYLWLIFLLSNPFDLSNLFVTFCSWTISVVQDIISLLRNQISISGNLSRSICITGWIVFF